jgi:uncharacterized membrane protein YozB (DUF420 family)
MQLLSIIAPFIALYAVSIAKKKKYIQHLKVQKKLFVVCVIGVIILEVQIKLSGGSGSLVEMSPYLSTTFFKVVLISHIIGSILTYIIWGILLFKSNKKHKKELLPGGFSKSHKKMGYITIIGLFYISITSLIILIMMFL